MRLIIIFFTIISTFCSSFLLADEFDNGYKLYKKVIIKMPLIFWRSYFIS